MEAISNTVAVCTSAVELDCRCMRWGTDLRPLMDRIFGTPFGNDRLRAIDFSDGDFGNAAEIVLACARECPHLRGLALPISLEEGTLGGLSFYEALARARPELTYLKLCRTFVEHDGILAAVSQLRLRCLEIENCVGSGIHDPALVDGILASPSAASLELLSLQESEWALGGLDVLRLVEGCPRLHTFYYESNEGHAEWDESDGALGAYNKAERIMRRRWRRDWRRNETQQPAGRDWIEGPGVFRSFLYYRIASAESLGKYSTPYIA